MDDLERRVWDRVLGQPEAVSGDVRALIMVSWELASGYAMLMKTAGEKTKPLLKGLQQREVGILHTLVGISRLQASAVQLKPLSVPKESALRLLEKSYHRSLRCRREYMARSAAGEYAEVFRTLADRAGEQCAEIAQTLGML